MVNDSNAGSKIVIKNTSKTSKKTFALNSKGLFHSHKPHVPTKCFDKLGSSFCIAYNELKTQQNTTHKKTAPTTPIAAGCGFFRAAPILYFHDLLCVKEK